MINREFIHILEQKLHKGKVILLVGPRQVGKTTLINILLKDKDFLRCSGGRADFTSKYRNVTKYDWSS